ncbi:class I SAM-dependent methyltransferase [Gracilibacillus caseinilyticus]|uniref:Class I SAM-dependent methyltransferase n=1 Tax=Gracilibacillus caseinilyticus TaxID=2932256 RepID=A0ABY4F0X8_9BACI|nr:class I SAM-dependent methyltransferase [Gracilibacillus caseinilyticus]UOQ48086.1 class I SAM-dependent methyltransferase [Gracilibacillus caseinilyticus]
MKAIIPYSHQLLQEVIKPGDVAIDATCGNGNDALLLSKLVENNGRVFAFDIQQQAITHSREMLDQHNVKNVELILDGHEHVQKYVMDTAVAGAIFNLGYLPKGDHSIVTTPDTTIEAIREITALLKKGGRIILVIYHGHPGGAEEKDSVLRFCQDLDQKHYQVLQYQFINQVNQPPFIVAIEKLI